MCPDDDPGSVGPDDGRHALIEGEIKCVCLRLRINDLNLVMEKGDIAYLPAPQVMASQDLMRLRAGVEVRFVNRCREERSPGPSMMQFRPEPGPPPPLPAPPVTVQVDLDALAEKVSARMPRIDENTLRQLVQMMAPLLVGAGGGQAPSQKPIGPTSWEPQFIPEMEALPAADISVQEQQVKGGTVDTAVAALKKARKPGEEHG